MATNDVQTQEAKRLEAIHEFNHKVFSARLNITNPLKDGKNPHFNSAFATYDSVKKAIESVCKPLGLKYTQRFDSSDLRSLQFFEKSGKMLLLSSVEDELNHSWEMGCIAVSLFDDPQKQGSELTYKRRYLAMLDWDLVGDDDDGNAASTTRDLQAELQAMKQKAEAEAEAYTYDTGPTKKHTIEDLWKVIRDLEKQVIAGGTKPEGIEKYKQATFHKSEDKFTYDDVCLYGAYLRNLLKDQELLK